MRLIGKILFVLFALSLLLSGAFLAYFNSWRAQAIRDLQKGSTVIETSAGKVGYAEKGKGPAVLILHGAPGGYDQGLLLGQNLADGGFRIICPSRPGYLRSPLGAALTPEEQSDALISLLDAMGIKEVAVLGFSVASTEAVQFALRHPDHVWAVVLVSGIYEKYIFQDAQKPGLLARILTRNGYGDIASWLLVEEAKYFPSRSLRRMLSCESSLDAKQRTEIADAIAKNPAQLAWYRALLGTTAPMSVRLSGFTNDLVQIRDLPPTQVYAAKQPPVQIPLLAIQGKMDTDSPPEKIQKILPLFPNLQTFILDGSGHIVWLGPNAHAADEKILSFLRSVAPPKP